MSNLRPLCALMRDPENRRDRFGSETAEPNDGKTCSRNFSKQGTFDQILRGKPALTPKQLDDTSFCYQKIYRFRPAIGRVTGENLGFDHRSQWKTMKECRKAGLWDELLERRREFPMVSSADQGKMVPSSRRLDSAFFPAVARITRLAKNWQLQTKHSMMRRWVELGCSLSFGIL